MSKAASLWRAFPAGAGHAGARVDGGGHGRMMGGGAKSVNPAPLIRKTHPAVLTLLPSGQGEATCLLPWPEGEVRGDTRAHTAALDKH